MMNTTFDAGIEVTPLRKPLGFRFGPGVFGPEVEYRSLDSIRRSLLDPGCSGPDPVYAIAMDVGKEKHRAILERNHLLFGVVTYAAGKLGREPVRSQGHVHKRTRLNKIAPPEIYEIWSGKAIIFMQERAEDNPGKCFAVEARPGEVVVVPPEWAHAAVSADQNEPLTFGAWCDRDYGFEYDKVRSHSGLAWFPIFADNGKIDWIPNGAYLPSSLVRKAPGDYADLGLVRGVPIYRLFEENADIFTYVANPETKINMWKDFAP